MFIYSKLPELFDTVFLVLRKKPVIFLHWFHHVTVGLPSSLDRFRLAGLAPARLERAMK